MQRSYGGPSPGRRSSCAARNQKLYGGAAGGGKSDALVIEALRQVHIPTIGAHPAQDLPPAQ